LQHLNESAKRALNPIRIKSPVVSEQREGGRATERGSASEYSPVAGVIACLDCKKSVEDVPELKRHMTSAHGGFSDSDIAAATAPESTVTVKRSTLHTALKAHDALAKEVASQNFGAQTEKGK